MEATPRVPTGVPGLDTVLQGGFLAGNAYLVVGEPGTGKTTLGNQLAFAHAAAGGTAIVATLLTETHDRMLAHLDGFRFLDPGQVGRRVHYFSLLPALTEGGLDAVLEGLRRAVRDHGATLLVVDGAAAAEEVAASGLDFGRFVLGLQARAALMRCTVVLLALGRSGEARGAAASADGVIELLQEPVASREVRWLRVAKLRGSASLTGRHQFGVGEAGVEVYPRLEAALTGAEPPKGEAGDRAAFGVPGLDAMLDGGLPRPSSTMVLGTPGAGKTVLGLHFLAEGARRGEPGLIAGFHETAPALADTAAGVGLDLGGDIDAGLVRVLWQPPLERSPDAWAWELLAAVEAHRPRRLVVDAFTDALRLFAVPQRQTAFLQALSNELRARRVTALFVVEIDTYVSAELATPFPAVSATMDHAILLRAVELRSRLHGLVSVLKMRQSGFDRAIREFAIGTGGMDIGEPFDRAAGLLTGGADPDPAEH